MNVSELVEADRVHKRVYTDQQIFDHEMAKIFEHVWVYCGHESQVPQPGDYHALAIGRQPMIMVRGKDRQIRVLYNRCPHRGVQLCGNQKATSAARWSARITRGAFTSMVACAASRSPGATTARG